MSYTTVPSNPFTVPGSAAGFLDIRKKASANGGTAGPVLTVAVPAYTAPATGDPGLLGVLPLPGVNKSTRVLSWSHPLGTSQEETQYGSSAYAAYAPIQVNSAGHLGGDWKTRIKAISGRAAGAPTPSPAISAATIAYPSKPIEVSCIGNSRDHGDQSPDPATMNPYALLSSLLDSAHFYLNPSLNKSVGGSTIAFYENGRSDYFTQYNQLPAFNSSTYSAGIVLIGDAVNSLGFDLTRTPQQIYGDLKTLCQTIIGSGRLPFVSTTLPQQSSSYTGITYQALQVRINIFNDLVRAGWAADLGAVNLADLVQVSSLQDPTVAPPYAPDFLHLFNYQPVADFKKPLIEDAAYASLAVAPPSGPDPSVPYPGALRNYDAALGLGTSSWTSQTSEHAVATLASGSLPTLVNNALNGHPALHFTNTELVEASNLGISGTGPRTIWVVARQTTTGNANLLGFGEADNLKLDDVLYLGGIPSLHVFTADTSGLLVPAEIPATTTFLLMGFIYNGTTVNVRINSQSRTDSRSAFASLVTTNSPLHIGGGVFNGLDGFVGDIAEILVRNDADAAAVAHDQNYLKTKYAIT